ncbi:MAG: DUF1127 domain-containing protein [Reyranellaceae bacterium]
MATLVHDRIAVPLPAIERGAGILPRLRATLALWARRIEEREALARFGWREMKDIALSESDIRREIAKPFWRA